MKNCFNFYYWTGRSKTSAEEGRRWSVLAVAVLVKWKAGQILVNIEQEHLCRRAKRKSSNLPPLSVFLVEIIVFSKYLLKKANKLLKLVFFGVIKKEKSIEIDKGWILTDIKTIWWQTKFVKALNSTQLAAQKYTIKLLQSIKLKR